MEDGESSCRRFPEGDKADFDAFIRENYKNLTFFIDQIVRDPTEAEDIAIDAFMELWERRRRIGSVSPKTCLYTIARCRALDCLRRRKRRREAPLDDALPSGCAAPDEGLLRAEHETALNAALAALPEDMRSAVHLVYFERLSYDEAAAVMKKSRKQVDNLLCRAKIRLRDALGKDGDINP